MACNITCHLIPHVCLLCSSAVGYVLLQRPLTSGKKLTRAVVSIICDCFPCLHLLLPSPSPSPPPCSLSLSLAVSLSPSSPPLPPSLSPPPPLFLPLPLPLSLPLPRLPLSHLQWLRIIRYSFLLLLTSLLWSLGLALCGALRTVLLWEHSDLALVSLLSILACNQTQGKVGVASGRSHLIRKPINM